MEGCPSWPGCGFRSGCNGSWQGSTHKHTQSTPARRTAQAEYSCWEAQQAQHAAAAGLLC